MGEQPHCIPAFQTLAEACKLGIRDPVFSDNTPHHNHTPRWSKSTKDFVYQHCRDLGRRIAICHIYRPLSAAVSAPNHLSICITFRNPVQADQASPSARCRSSPRRVRKAQCTRPAKYRNSTSPWRPPRQTLHTRTAAALDLVCWCLVEWPNSVRRTAPIKPNSSQVCR